MGNITNNGYIFISEKRYVVTKLKFTWEVCLRFARLVFCLFLSGWISPVQAECWIDTSSAQPVQRMIDQDPGKAIAVIDRHLMTGKSLYGLSRNDLHLAKAEAYGLLEMHPEMAQAAAAVLRQPALLDSNTLTVALFLRAGSLFDSSELEVALPSLEQRLKMLPAASYLKACATLQLAALQSRLGWREKSTLALLDVHAWAGRHRAFRLRAVTAEHLATAMPGAATRRLALVFGREAELYFQGQGSTMRLADSIYYQGLVRLRVGQPRQALAYFQRALALHRTLQQTRQATLLETINICRSYVELENLRAAIPACRPLEEFLRQPDPPFLSNLLQIVGEKDLLANRPYAAIAKLTRAIDANTLTIGNSAALLALRARGRAYAQIGAYAAAYRDAMIYADLQKRQEDVDGTFAQMVFRGQLAAATLAQEETALERELAARAKLAKAREQRLYIAVISFMVLIALTTLVLIQRNRFQARRLLEARERSDLLADLHHEIRSAVGGVALLTSVLNRMPALPQEERYYLQQMDRQIRRVTQMLSDSLDYARLQARALELKPGNVLLLPFVERVLEPHRLAAEARGVAVLKMVESDVPEGIFADEERLQQVLDNLLHNAARHTRSGEIELRVSCIGAESMVRFAVRDTGVGIAKSDQKRVFRRFKQGQGAARALTRATSGLGLAICHKLVALMGGRMGLSSEMGQGTTVWFVIPLVRPLLPTPV